MPNCMPNRLNRPPKRLNREHHQDEMHEEGEKEKFEMPPMRRSGVLRVDGFGPVSSMRPESAGRGRWGV
jgi:hypothetical protein